MAIKNIGGFDMKKTLWTGILAAALAFTICPANALAADMQYPGSQGRFNANGAGLSFVDDNGDGICDNYASGACGGGYCGGAGRQGGLNQGRGLRNSQCLWHVSADGSWVHCADADGDGVCDTCGVTLPLGIGFVDEDGDGICDNYASGACGGGYCGGAGRLGGGRGGRRK